MSVLVAGSLGLDAVETPREKRDEQPGGSAAYFACAAGFFTPVHLISVVGDDWPDETRAFLRRRGVDLSGVQVIPGGRTFRWSGRYHADFIGRDTVKTELNVLGSFDPRLPEAARRCPFVFLANGPCAIQRKVLAQMARRPRFAVADTMDLWIRSTPAELKDLLRLVDGLVLNDSEARLLTGRHDLLRAAREALQLGPKVVIIKKGEHGAMLLSRSDCFVLPAYPLAEVVDPTGAGDSFAGGFMGSLAAAGRVTPANLRRALVWGTVVASFVCQDFSFNALRRLNPAMLKARERELLRLIAVPADRGRGFSGRVR